MNSESPDSEKNVGSTPLAGNPDREASDTIRGYGYQIWQSVLAWINLDKNEILYLEGLEDIDVVSDKNVTAVQVKDTPSEKITLNSKNVKETIENYWGHLNRNKEYKVKLKYLTRSKITFEVGHPFGQDVFGLKLWNDCLPRNLNQISEIRKFLSNTSWSASFENFLKTATDNDFYEKIISSISWEVEQENSENIQEIISKLLITYSEDKNINSFEIPIISKCLFSEVWNIAGRKQDRFLTRADFVRAFDDVTSVVLRRKEFEQLKKLAENNFISALALPNTTVSVIGTAFVQRLEETSFKTVLRESLVNLYKQQINDQGFTVLYGSSGIGKSILAKQLAQATGFRWHFLNLSHLTSAETKDSLFKLILLKKQNDQITNVIIDDIDLSPGSYQVLEMLLQTLFNEFGQKKHRLIITSQNQLTGKLERQLQVNQKYIKPIPNFTKNEIIDFALQLGCPSSELANSWSEIIVLHTSGHPQLVHASLSDLTRVSWPLPNAENFFKPLEGITNEQRDVKKILIDRLPEKQKSLIYNLSIINSHFRRDHALIIGQVLGGSQFPGEDFDKLVGPWIERITDDYFILSPLLNKVAQQEWPVETIFTNKKKMTELVVSCGKLSQIEAKLIFYNSLETKSEGPLSSILGALIRTSKKVWDQVANEFSLVAVFGLANKKPIYPENQFINYLLRLFQFEVATTVKPELLPQIFELWNSEINQMPRNEFFYSCRFMFLLKVIVNPEVKIPIKTRFQFISEIETLQKENKKTVSEMLQDFNKSGKNRDQFSELFEILTFNCNSRDETIELIEALENSSSDLKNSYFKPLNKNLILSEVLVNDTWMNESKKEKPDWELCLRALNQIVTFSKKYNLLNLKLASIRGMAVIYDEYLNKKDQALSIIETNEKELGSLAYLEDEKALIYLHQDRFSEAAKIWEVILPVLKKESGIINTKVMFVYRLAGMAASSAREFDKSINFFTEMSKLAIELKKEAYAIGAIVDKSMVFWIAGQQAEAFSTAVEALERLGKVDKFESDYDFFKVSKILGNYFLWMRLNLSGIKTENIVGPMPGICSSPNKYEKVMANQNPTPINGCWALAADVEYYLNIGSKVFEYFSSRCEKSSSAWIVSEINVLSIKHSFRKISFERLPSQALLYLRSVLSIANGKADFKNPESVEISVSEISIFDDKKNFNNFILFFIGALTVLQATRKLDINIFEKWKNDLNSPLNDKFIGWLDMAKSTILLDANSATAILKSNQEVYRRIISAIRLSAEENINIYDLFLSHFTIVQAAVIGDIRECVVCYISEMFTKEWLKRIEFRSALTNPNVTVVGIKAACKKNSSCYKKVAEILIAASEAVPIHLSEDQIKSLNSLWN